MDLVGTRTRRAEIALGLLLAACSFLPWWTRRADGHDSSAWTGPHFSWLAVLLCLAIVAGRSFSWRFAGDRWAAVAVVAALAVAASGWFSEKASELSRPGEGSDRFGWVLLDEAASSALPVGGPSGAAWGYAVGLCLMALLLAVIVWAAWPRRAL